MIRNPKTLIIKSRYTQFDAFVNDHIKKCNICDINEDIFNRSNPFELLINIVKTSKHIKKSNYDVIIVFDEYKIALALSTLLRRKISLFFWNTLNDTEKSKIDSLKNKLNIYTFDYNDAETYKLKLTQNFYFSNIDKKQTNTVNDVFFIGIDKDRYKIIEYYSNLFEKKHISYIFKLFKNKKQTYSNKSSNFLTDKYVSYEDTINYIQESKAILDITKKGQEGITIRILEAIYFNKKIITNNKHIINEKLYNKNNVFILDIDSVDNLETFINSDTIDYGDKIRNYYSFEEWIKNFY